MDTQLPYRWTFSYLTDEVSFTLQIDTLSYLTVGPSQLPYSLVHSVTLQMDTLSYLTDGHSVTLQMNFLICLTDGYSQLPYSWTHSVTLLMVTLSNLTNGHSQLPYRWISQLPYRWTLLSLYGWSLSYLTDGLSVTYQINTE